MKQRGCVLSSKPGQNGKAASSSPARRNIFWQQNHATILSKSLPVQKAGCNTTTKSRQVAHHRLLLVVAEAPGNGHKRGRVGRRLGKGGKAQNMEGMLLWGSTKESYRG